MPRCPKCHFAWVSTSRSDKQCRYYFGVIVSMLSEEYGNELEEQHQLLITRFLRPLGIESTTELTTGEFITYCEKIQRWAIQQDPPIRIPDPNEKTNS